MNTHLWNTHKREKINFQSGKGCFLFRRRFFFIKEKYLDFSAGGGVNSLGYKNKRLIHTLKKQADTGIWHLSNYYENPLAQSYAKKLCSLSGMETAFFTNSGTESNEAAIKLARKYFEGTGKYEIIALERAFHGRTIGSLSATFNIKYKKGFEPLAPGFLFAPPDLKAIESLITDKTAAIIIEPIQGEGGINCFAIEFLEELYAITRKRGILLIFDEVQTGFGRTGPLFVFQSTEIIPDIITLAKGIAGGFPFGAVLTREAVSKCMEIGTHGGTFGGNLLALACAREALEQISSERFMRNIKNSSAELTLGLHELHRKNKGGINAIKGTGLMMGLELAANINASRFKTIALKKERLLIGALDGNIIRITPPLIITPEEIKIGVSKLNRLIALLNKP